MARKWEEAWACGVCTLINMPSAQACDACLAPRPAGKQERGLGIRSFSQTFHYTRSGAYLVLARCLLTRATLRCMYPTLTFWGAGGKTQNSYAKTVCACVSHELTGSHLRSGVLMNYSGKLCFMQISATPVCHSVPRFRQWGGRVPVRISLQVE